jgi:hypothetical protein
MMELINALDCNEGTSQFEMPASGVSAVARLREMVQDSIRYAADLSQTKTGQGPTPSGLPLFAVSAIPIYETLIEELAVLECVRQTLIQWEFAGMPTDGECKITSAELTLMKSIARLGDLSDDLSKVKLFSSAAVAKMETDERAAQEHV